MQGTPTVSTLDQSVLGNLDPRNRGDPAIFPRWSPLLGKLSHCSSFSPLEGDFSQARASPLTGFWALSMTPSPNHAGVLWPLPDLSLFDPHGHCLCLATPSPPTRAPLSLLQASKAVRLRQLPKHLGLAQREPLTVSLSSSHVPECLVFFPFLRKKIKQTLM